MKKIVLLGVALILIQLPLLALVLTQERTWGGPDLDEASGVATSPDNSVYVTGTTLSFGVGDRDAFLLKYGVNGDLLWQRTYGTPQTQPFLRADEFSHGVATSPDGTAAYITGQFGDGSVFLVKFDSEGALVWQRTFGINGNFASGIAVAGDGSIYVTGGTGPFDDNQGDALLVKFTPDGLLEWDLKWGALGRDVARDVAVSADGSVYLAGETSSFVANDAFVVKVSASGAVLWERDWGVLDRDGFPGLVAAFAVGAAPDGSVYITGNAFGAGGDNNVILVKFDASGALVWEKIGGPGFGAGLDIAVAADGGLFVAGNLSVETRGVVGGHAFVAAFQADGRKKKAIAWGSAIPNNASAESIAISPDGKIVAAGFAQSPPYVVSSVSNSARAVDAFLEIVVGIASPLLAPVNNLPLGLVTTPVGSQTFAGQNDAVLLRMQR
jgi:DNA-binding beta-propeller fold protein YncE